MTNLLITGGAGFIGSNFTQYWRATHPAARVIVLDALTYAGDLRNLEALDGVPQFRFVHGDINDQGLVEALLREEAIDVLLNVAAESHVDRSIADADAFIRTNIVGTHSLLKAARRVWLEERRVPAHRFHHVSTDEVYGSLEPQLPAVDETSAYAPSSPYAASKAGADHLVRAWARTYGLDVSISHCCNNYGPRQFPEKLVPRAIVNLLTGQVVPIYGDGGQHRDWLHVHDHCRGLELVLKQGIPGEIYHLAGGETAANLALVKRLCRIVDEFFMKDGSLAPRYPAAPASRSERSEALVKFVSDRPGHDRRYKENGEKARRALGFLPGVSLGEGLRDTVRWYLANEPWWRAHA